MDLEASVQRILDRGKNLADLFYCVFLDRYPELRRHFTAVDLSHQAALLTMALQVIAEHHLRHSPAAAEYLLVLGHRHHAWGIELDEFPKFRDCLLDTLQQFHGQDWHDALARQWRAAIDEAIDTMRAGYAEPHTL